jgi:DNA-binding transcriptional MocR family regulator
MASVQSELENCEVLQSLLPKRDRIKATLRTFVQTLPPGAALPSIAALCQQFGVSQHTIDRVIDDLRAEGLLETRRRTAGDDQLSADRPGRRRGVRAGIAQRRPRDPRQSPGTPRNPAQARRGSDLMRLSNSGTEDDDTQSIMLILFME